MRKVWLVMTEEDGIETVHSVYDSEEKAQAWRQRLMAHKLYECVYVVAMYVQ